MPEFNPAILKVKVEGTAIGILETVPIVGQSGKPVTGLPNLNAIEETPYDYSGEKELVFNVNCIDPEGLVRTSNGDLWVSEEYSPSLLHLDRSGRYSKDTFRKGSN